MNREILAIVLQEGGRFISEFIKTRSFKRVTIAEPPPATIITAIEPQETIGEDRASSIEEGIACLPCVNGHFSTCSGLVSDEAIRMARRHGIGDEEISRINKCLDQLNAMEREDLSAEKIRGLPEWEKEIAIYAQSESASIRHKLESMSSVDDLENVAVQIKEARIRVGKDYFKGRLAHMSKEEKKRVAEKVMEKLEEEDNR